MHHDIKVTIGLCVKNAEATVKQAIDSILKQDFPREQMELIVVDGNSEDKTLPIIEENLAQANMGFKVFRENGGLGLARYLVVDNANGHYVIWVDGDIILPRDYVRKLIEFMEQNPKVGIAGGKYGNYPGQTLASALENIVYVVDSQRGGKAPFESTYLPKTEGAVYRVEAIKQAGNFNINITGAGEDLDAAWRVQTAGWELRTINSTFYESCRETWKDLWDQYFWYGYGGHYLSHKNKSIIPLYKMTPPIAFLAGLLRLSVAYKLTKRKAFFLLPLHYVFKRVAWCFGFAKGHIDGYGH